MYYNVKNNPLLLYKAILLIILCYLLLILLWYKDIKPLYIIVNINSIILSDLVLILYN